MYMDGIQGVQQYAQAYDTTNHIYYVAVALNSDPNTAFYYGYNLMTKKVEAKLTVPNILHNAEFDRNGNRIIGVVNDVLCYLDLKSGKFVQTSLNLAYIGFRQLGSSAIDENYYYTFYENHLVQSFFVKVDLKTLTVVNVSEIYNLVGPVVFLPGK